MLVTLGFLIAALIVVVLLPAYRHRIERFTTEAMKRSLPLTEAEIRADFERLGLSTTGVDFEKLATAQRDDSRRVPDWEAPRDLSADWKEYFRDDQGSAGWINAQRRLKVFLSCSFEQDGRAWLHVTVSHTTKRTPTHGELRIVKETFLGDRYAFAIYPPRAKYVNIGEVLHLFALLDEAAPSPLPDFTADTGSL